MQFRYKCLFIISPLVFALDQFTKYLVISNVTLTGRIPVIPSFFDIVHFTNSGAAFGMLSGHGDWKTPFFYIVSIAALIAILIYMIKLPATERLTAVAFSLVVGGIFGNGLDRVRFQEVTDFLSFYIGDKSLFGVRLEWPAFNIADSAITVAMVLLVISAFRKNSS